MANYGLILAAGNGKRMKSNISKVLHKVCGKELVRYVYEAIDNENTIIVAGENREIIKKEFPNAQVAYQAERKGTAHAVMCARELLEGKEGYVTITAGDMPLLTKETLATLIEKTRNENLSACVLSAIVENPFGYGRIVRDENGNIQSIVEQRDATEEQKKICEINSSVYCFEISTLLENLQKIKNNNDQGEYYLTDVIENIPSDKKSVLVAEDFREVMGINDRVQLAEAEQMMRRRINKKIMLSGVTLIDPENTYIESDVVVGKDTVIYPNNLIQGKTVIGENCIIYPGCRLQDSVIGDAADVTSSVMIEAKVGSNTHVGPNAYLRKGTDVGNDARIGDFVEIKNSKIGNGTKVSHLTYVGDATVGEDCNMGCGTVFVNYDGKNKFHSNVGNHVFIGCNSNIIAPVNIGDNTLIAAATTVTEDIDNDDMAIGRCRQQNKKGWVKNYKNW